MSRAVLAEAVGSGDTAAVRAAIEQFPALESHLDAPLAGAPFGTTPLLAAASKGNREMVDLLLSAGADINARSHWWAGSFGVLDSAPLEMAPFLLQRGALLDAHSASRLNMLPELTAMLDANPALAHARGADGQTPLHFAASVETAALLLHHGAKIDARDIDHESTPAQYMLRDRLDLAKFLVAQGCRTDILMATAVGDLERVRQHLSTAPQSIYTAVSEHYFPKIDPHSGGTIYIWTLGLFKTAHPIARGSGNPDTSELLDAHTPPDLQFLLAAQENNLELVTKLISAGLLTNVENERLTATPLHWAAWHGNRPMVANLLRLNVPLEARDSQYGMSPLGWALHAFHSGNQSPASDFPGTIAALQSAGALPLAR